MNPRDAAELAAMNRQLEAGIVTIPARDNDEQAAMQAELETAAEMNRLSRMTREQREESVAKEMLGPWFRAVFPDIAEPRDPLAIDYELTASERSAAAVAKTAIERNRRGNMKGEEA